MASLSIKFLTALGIDEDKAEQICERHKEVLTEIKEERDKYKEEAEKLPDIQKQLDDYKKAEADAKAKGENDPYKVKYEALKEEFDNYKTEIANKETKTKKENAYRQLLKDAGVSEKRIDSVLKVSNIDSLEFDDEGKVKDSDKLTESIKTEWSDFIQTSSVAGANTANPPTSTTDNRVDLGKLSMADYIKARKEQS